MMSKFKWKSQAAGVSISIRVLLYIFISRDIRGLSDEGNIIFDSGENDEKE
jgi:hypothetical protein